MSARRFVLHAALVFTLSYLVWLPLEPLYTRLLAHLAAPALRLIDRPPLLTSLAAHGSAIHFCSFLTGANVPMASWSGETQGVVLLAPLALALALPGLHASRRLLAGTLALALSVVTSALVAAVEIRIAAGRHAAEQWALVVDEPASAARLIRLHEILHVVGMLALPALVFVGGYASALWLGPAGARPAWRRAGLAVLVLPLLGAVAWVGLDRLVPRASARTGWSEVLRLNPGFAPAHVNVGLALDEEGRHDEAVAQYLRALELEPRLAEAHYNLGNARAALGQDELAVESFGALLALEPEHRAAHRNLALALLRLGQPCEALPHLERSSGAGADAAAAREIERLRAICPLSGS